ncbi:hypothetical protein HPC49_45900 [Pyxidicoccus fallax]|uniref:Lipoprotein n=1 Tax=Pyxidicoccus fallax TaxID=394095 RepID=A0A848LUS5_9BACT|nr:hypothetical protein [Pyxidicoccus fallax]NMO21399.1 hypothetical protein [Pyxidicoccus fallax]NPC85516.1 hypothetical protein [Pyxidicoccus fallax]
MSALSLALFLSLTQAATAGCQGEKVVLLPFDTVALSRAETRALEEAARRAVAATPGVCLESRADTVERLRALGPGALACEGSQCLGARGVAPGAAWLVRGVALGLGGGRSVVLSLVDSLGWESRQTFQLPGVNAEPGEAEAKSRQSFKTLWTARPSARGAVAERTAGVEKPARVWPKVLLAAGGAALAAGVGFGMASRRAESRLSAGNAGCAGDGEAFRACLDGKLRDGRRQAHTANVLLGAGALLGAGGTFFLVWELP